MTRAPGAVRDDVVGFRSGNEGGTVLLRRNQRVGRGGWRIDLIMERFTRISKPPLLSF